MLYGFVLHLGPSAGGPFWFAYFVLSFIRLVKSQHLEIQHCRTTVQLEPKFRENGYLLL